MKNLIHVSKIAYYIKHSLSEADTTHKLVHINNLNEKINTD